jgi:hypothetical protein
VRGTPNNCCLCSSLARTAAVARRVALVRLRCCQSGERRGPLRGLARSRRTSARRCVTLIGRWVILLARFGASAAVAVRWDNRLAVAADVAPADWVISASGRIAAVAIADKARSCSPTRRISCHPFRYDIAIPRTLHATANHPAVTATRCREAMKMSRKEGHESGAKARVRAATVVAAADSTISPCRDPGSPQRSSAFTPAASSVAASTGQIAGGAVTPLRDRKADSGGWPRRSRNGFLPLPCAATGDSDTADHDARHTGHSRPYQQDYRKLPVNGLVRRAAVA